MLKVIRLFWYFVLAALLMRRMWNLQNDTMIEPSILWLKNFEHQILKYTSYRTLKRVFDIYSVACVQNAYSIMHIITHHRLIYYDYCSNINYNPTFTFNHNEESSRIPSTNQAIINHASIFYITLDNIEACAYQWRLVWVRYFLYETVSLEICNHIDIIFHALTETLV